MGSFAVNELKPAETLELFYLLNESTLQRHPTEDESVCVFVHVCVFSCTSIFKKQTEETREAVFS